MTSNRQAIEASAEQAVKQVVAKALHGQAAMLNDQLSAMNASRAELAARAQSASGPDVARLHEALAQHDAAAAELQGRLADVNGKLAELQAGFQPGTHTGAPSDNWRQPILNIDPDAITAVFLMLSIGLIVPVSIGLTRRLWRRPQPEQVSREVEAVSKARLDRLEQAVDAIAIEIERISEGQRFVTRVLAERQSPNQPVGNAEAGASAGLGEAKPFLALGAGPMEPIRVPERPMVKQSITPH